jgi:hypothetical protein
MSRKARTTTVHFRRWWRDACARFAPRRNLRIVSGDSLPRRLPRRDLVLARDESEEWCVGLRCPCGCGRTIELLLVPEASPRWDLALDAQGRLSLTPSVWINTGCRSHFWYGKGASSGAIKFTPWHWWHVHPHASPRGTSDTWTRVSPRAP